MSLSDAVDFVRPALLYADKVTIHAPSASLLHALGGLAQYKSPTDQLDFMATMAREYPDAFADAIPLPQLEALQRILRIDRSVVRGLAESEAEAAETDTFYAQIDGLEHLFQELFGTAMATATSEAGAADLLAAADAGLLEIAPLKEMGSGLDALAGAIRGTSSPEGAEGFVDDIVLSFIDTLLDVLADADGLPLLDRHAAGLARALSAEGLVEPSVGQRELAAGAGLLTSLPTLKDVPLDAVVDMRTNLHAPLTRFRASVSAIGRQFQSEVYDETIQNEIRLAWRETVEPELLYIREGLQEGGMLRTVASTAMENPYASVRKAGIPLMVGHAAVDDVSQLALAALAAGVPIGDTVIRAFKESRAARREIRRNSFYFLHAVSERTQ